MEPPRRDVERLEIDGVENYHTGRSTALTALALHLQLLAVIREDAVKRGLTSELMGHNIRTLP